MVAAIGLEVMPAEVVRIVEGELDVALGIPPEGDVVVGVCGTLELLLCDGLQLFGEDGAEGIV
ncbi:MAG TPA: hypothetical protein VHN13_19930 [Candidatus Tectomicrobia bacterium]|nr:hypothetical protein [Candidatus Tectomicrobia bacterium]